MEPPAHHPPVGRINPWSEIKSLKFEKKQNITIILIIVIIIPIIIIKIVKKMSKRQ